MVPPLWIVSAPVAETPTLRPVDCAPAALTAAIDRESLEIDRFEPNSPPENFGRGGIWFWRGG